MGKIFRDGERILKFATRNERNFLKLLNEEFETDFKIEQLVEWSTEKVSVREGESIFFVKKIGVYVVIKL